MNTPKALSACTLLLVLFSGPQLCSCRRHIGRGSALSSPRSEDAAQSEVGVSAALSSNIEEASATCISRQAGSVFKVLNDSNVTDDTRLALETITSLLSELAPSRTQGSGGNPSPAEMYDSLMAARDLTCNDPASTYCLGQSFTVLVPPNRDLELMRKRLQMEFLTAERLLYTLFLHIIPGRRSSDDLLTSERAGTEELRITPLAGVAIPGETLLVQPPSGIDDELMFMYDRSTAIATVTQSDIATCHEGSIVHVVTGLLVPGELPEGVLDWENSNSSGEGEGSGRFSSSSAVLRRNSTLLMSVLLVLGVLGLVFGVFWGRYRLNAASNNARQTGSSLGSAYAFGQDAPRLLLKNVPEQSAIVALEEPKVVYRWGVQLWSMSPPDKCLEGSDGALRMQPMHADTQAAVLHDSATESSGQEQTSSLENNNEGNTEHDPAQDLSCTCFICFEGAGNHVLFTCGHGGYCHTCAHKLITQPAPKRVCPVCRTGLDTIVEIDMGVPVGGEGNVLSAVGVKKIDPVPEAATSVVDSISEPSRSSNDSHAESATRLQELAAVNFTAQPVVLVDAREPGTQNSSAARNDSEDHPSPDSAA